MMLITVYLKITKRTNDGHCGMEAETYIQFVQHVAQCFPAEVNEETTFTGDHMESYLMCRTESNHFIETKAFLVDGLIRRGYDIGVVRMDADGEQLDDEVMMDIMDKQPIQKRTKKRGLLGFIKQFMFQSSAIGEVVPNEWDEEYWEDEEDGQ